VSCRSVKSRAQSKRLVSKAPALLLAIGVISLVGTIGAPNLAGATPRHSAPAVKVSRVVARKGALHASLFNAGHVQKASRPAAAKPFVKPAVHADVPTLYVNANTGNNVGSCRLHADPCQTITYAISQAPPAANIDVANGTYAEQVVDSTSLNLNIVGASEAGTIIEPSSVPVGDQDTDSSSLEYAIVDAQPGSKVNLSDLTIDGEAAINTFTCGSEFDGVYYHDAKGSMSHVTVENIELPMSDFGCQGGLAIYAAADSAMTTTVTMTTVTVNTYDKNGITCDDPGTTCTVSSSTVTGIGCTNLIAQNGIQGYDAGTVTLTSDTVSDNCYNVDASPYYVATGVLLYDNAHSTATTVTADGDDVGIYAGNDGGGPATTTISITHCIASNASNASTVAGLGIGVDSATAGTVEYDTMKDDTGGGLAVYGSSGLTIEHNKANSDSDGFYIGGPGTVGANSTGNTIESNKVNKDTDDGMYVDSDTSGNTFTSNTGKHDVNYSFQDFSSGSGTAHTANTWHTNVCHPAGDSSPGGLC
jgi:parallel beta-helix repeat protein